MFRPKACRRSETRSGTGSRSSPSSACLQCFRTKKDLHADSSNGNHSLLSSPYECCEKESNSNMQKSGTDSARRRYPKISFGLSWIAIIPGSIWIIETYYLPVFGGKLNPEQSLLAAPVILLFVAFSLLCHLVAHVGAGRSLGIVIPATLTLLIFGDVSQSWPQTRSPRSDFLVAA